MTTQAAISGHEAEHHGPNYIAVFIYLSVLTAIELGVYAMGLPQVAKVGLLIRAGVGKGSVGRDVFHASRDGAKGARDHRDYSGDTRHLPVLHAAARSDDADVDPVRSSEARDESCRDGCESGRAAADANAVVWRSVGFLSFAGAAERIPQRMRHGSAAGRIHLHQEGMGASASRVHDHRDGVFRGLPDVISHLSLQCRQRALQRPRLGPLVVLLNPDSARNPGRNNRTARAHDDLVRATRQTFAVIGESRDGPGRSGCTCQ